MFIIYNILQVLALPILLPLLPVVLYLRRKDWGRMSARCGAGLTTKLQKRKRSPVFWIHALSVGEITSSVPLIEALKNKYPECLLIVSASTRSGKELADSILKDIADSIIDGPFDLLPVVHKYLDVIQPDCFILVETDFWPNLLFTLKQRKIPTFLVNGRISHKSFRNYKKFSFFFTRMFKTFSALCMQTEQDKSNMIQFGVGPEKLYTLGNLKLDAAQHSNENTEIPALIPPNRTIFTCGSTHPGEEQTLLQTYKSLISAFPSLFLIIVPRNPKRGSEVLQLANSFGLSGTLRSEQSSENSQLLVVNTLGELSSFYSYSDIAFVGGSITANGGHNPIEPAIYEIPVLFGTHMEDFSELAAILCKNGGAFTVTDSESLYATMSDLLTDSAKRSTAGKAARNTVQTLQGVVANHLQLIDQFL